MATLHILNGDSTKHGFDQSNIEGDVMVWREVLSEGPIEADIASAHFWKMRSEWICKTFDDSPIEYQHDFVDHLAELTEPYDEINLWFEYDLHCQSNMLGVMNYLSQQTDLSGPAIYLICPAEFPGKPNFAGMGELNGEELEYLFDNIRLRLSEADFVIAAEVWNLYVQQDEKALAKYLKENTFWGSLHLLKGAMTAHLKRLQINTDGLNYVEQKILDLYNDGFTDQLELCRVFGEEENMFGLGDLEVGLYLGKLKNKGKI